MYVESEHDTAYAFDADSSAILWEVSLLGANETTSDTRGCGQVVPEIGITATPVIDPKQGSHGAIYIAAMSKDSSGNYHQRLHALDLTTGAELTNSPVEVQATYPGTGDNSSNGKVIFDPGQYEERAGLLLSNGTIYLTWTSHCDIRPYTGWIMAYSESSLAQTSILNLTPNGSEGSFWMSGAGPATDSSGDIFLLEANGTFDSTLNTSGMPGSGDFGNSFLKISTATNQLAVADYFEMSNQLNENDTDTDLGSGGALVLPDLTDASGTTRHLALGAGKDGNVYVVNRDSMGKFNANGNNIYQELQGALPGGIYGMAAYFNNTVYYGPVGGNILAFPITNAKLAAAPSSQTSASFEYPGATPSISANQTNNAILWAAENSDPAVLYAYDATNLANELYNSNQSGTRDQFGTGNKFITPMIANGKVFVGTTTGVAVFGLLQ